MKKKKKIMRGFAVLPKSEVIRIATMGGHASHGGGSSEQQQHESKEEQPCYHPPENPHTTKKSKSTNKKLKPPPITASGDDIQDQTTAPLEIKKGETIIKNFVLQPPTNP